MQKKKVEAKESLSIPEQFLALRNLVSSLSKNHYSTDHVIYASFFVMQVRIFVTVKV